MNSTIKNDVMDDSQVKIDDSDKLLKVKKLTTYFYTEEGIVKAVEAGVIDIPFAPSVFNAGKVMPARDSQGMVRYLDTGNIPFSDKVRKFNRRRLEERAVKEEREVSFQMTIDDVFAVSEGKLIGNHKK